MSKPLQYESASVPSDGTDSDIFPTDINAATTLVGLFGWPVTHSISPQMHNAAFVARQMNWRYLAFAVPPERVSEAVAALPALGLRGVNVTVPHKQAVMPHLQHWTPAAEAIGAVNTIVVEKDGQLTGDNTDGAGFIADLKAHNVEPEGRRALVIGAGGSSRAVVYGLAEAGVESVMILNRTVEKAVGLAATMQSYFPEIRVDSAAFPDDVTGSAQDANLIVNCTSLGMEPRIEGLPWEENVEFREDQIVYDLVYNPAMTRLLQLASTDGATAIGGLGMLVYQGAIAWEKWTGETAPVDVMQQATNIIFERR
ncbi:MAG: shikimate dehydrogenase [Caldilineaceae bacterium]|nr:shikimate dehydrogenase [Caldilineaceae bacterium]MDE0465346.1 shikimate dehydrogenase [Caldilineaceae bacterium]